TAPEEIEPPHAHRLPDLSPEPETLDVDPAELEGEPLAAAPPVALGDVEMPEPPTADGEEPGPAAEDAPAGPVRMAPIPSVQPPPVAFEREEDASALLLRQQQRDAWVARAEWLRAEAEAKTDPAARARGLLVVSELYAMSGEETTARAVADEA